MEQDPIGTYMATTQKGAIVTGTVKEVDAKGATIELEGGIEGYVRASDIAKERVEDASQHLKVGDTVEAKYMGMDRKGRVMQLSIRAKDEADVADAMAEVNQAADASAGTTKLGALLREQLNKGE
jgi:small subunit ribosomal protein S1